MTKKFEFYWGDLTPECRKRFIEFYGDNGNYDYIPFYTMEVEDDDEGEEHEYSVDCNVEGFWHWQGKAKSRKEAKEKALSLCSEADFGELTNIDYRIYTVE